MKKDKYNYIYNVWVHLGIGLLYLISVGSLAYYLSYVKHIYLIGAPLIWSCLLVFAYTLAFLQAYHCYDPLMDTFQIKLMKIGLWPRPKKLRQSMMDKILGKEDPPEPFFPRHPNDL